MHIQPRTKDDASSRKFPYVLFSAPPSGSTDYPAEVISPFADHLPSFDHVKNTVKCNLYMRSESKDGCKGIFDSHLRHGCVPV